MSEDKQPPSPDPEQKLLLFDIDGTLVRTAGVGRDSMNLAFKKIFGIRNAFEGVEMMGRTDPLILEEVLKNHQLNASHQEIEDFKELYFAILEETIELPRIGKRLCPGIDALLKHLEEKSNSIRGLLTGNWRYGAFVKLHHFDLDRYFTMGVFADDNPNREEMVPVAIEKIESRYGFQLQLEKVYIIGDTPRDINCAKPHGVVTIGVATGLHDLQSLIDAGADYTFENFEAVDEALNLLC